MSASAPTASARIGGFAAVGSTLYGLADDDNLYAINPTTAALTLIGDTGIVHGGYGLGETSDGTIYAILQNTKLYTLNVSTALPTFVGNMGFSTNSDPSGDASGGLYAAQGADGNGIYSIDPTTGAGTLLGTDSIGTVLALGTCLGRETPNCHNMRCLQISRDAAPLRLCFHPGAQAGRAQCCRNVVP
jgi:hypothetical protein